jgi:hypothetical protein
VRRNKTRTTRSSLSRGWLLIIDPKKIIMNKLAIKESIIALVLDLTKNTIEKYMVNIIVTNVMSKFVKSIF